MPAMFETFCFLHVTEILPATSSNMTDRRKESVKIIGLIQSALNLRANMRATVKS